MRQRLFILSLTSLLGVGAQAQTVINLDSLEGTSSGARRITSRGPITDRVATETGVTYSVDQIVSQFGVGGYISYTLTFNVNANAANWDATTESGGTSQGNSITTSFTNGTNYFGGVGIQDNTYGTGYVVAPINSSGTFSFANTFGGGYVNDDDDNTTRRGSTTRITNTVRGDNTMTLFVEHLNLSGAVLKTDTMTFALATPTSTLLTPKIRFNVGFDTGADAAGFDAIDPNGQWSVAISDATFRSVQAVPEPGTLAALGLGAIALLRRRKRA